MFITQLFETKQLNMYNYLLKFITSILILNFSKKFMKRDRSKSVTMLLSTQDGNTEEKGMNTFIDPS